jgi:hypothetical protein
MMGSRSPQQDKTAPEVALVFPPLVETNFGCYYPSTAVLAGYLSAKGINSVQADLNEDFATYLLRPESLKRMAKGEFGDKLESSPSSMPAVAARLLIRYGHALLDKQGKHLFRVASSDIAHLLGILAQPYRIDMPLSVMTSPGFYDQPEVLACQTFLERTNYARTLPASIHAVGVSIPVGPQLAPALILARYLKTLRPDLAIILGGSTISLMTLADIEKILACNPAVDAVVSCDGERPLEALLEQRRAGNWEPAKVPGVSCRVGTKVIHRPPQAGPGLGSIPYAEYDSQLLSRLAEPEIGIVQSRGCYWRKCAYCDYVELYKGSRPVRARTPGSFVDEMEYQVQKHGVHQFLVITEAIAPAFARTISKLILQRGLRVKWHSFAMIDKRFTPDVFKIMVRAGCEFLVIGVETMTNRVLHLMNKAATKEDNTKFLLDARASGLDIKINIIPDLPSTTYQEAMDSLALFEELQQCFNNVAYFPFEATRSSRIGRQPERFGLRSADSDSTTGQAQFTLNHLEVSDPAMTADEREQVYAEYQAFAAQVNNRRDMDPPPTVLREDTIKNARFRLADEFLDLTPVEGGVQCYNWLTRKRFQMPEEWPGLIEKIRSKQPLRRDDFIRWFSPLSSGEFYFNKLLEKGILAIDEPPNRE